MGKLDIESAFNLCPVHPADFNLLGIKFENKYWIQKMLPQGASISCAIFEKFAKSLHWVVTNNSNPNIDHYLDDFIFLGKPESSECQNSMDYFRYICEYTGIPLSEDKFEGPITILTYLGIELDSEKMEFRIPVEKIKNILKEIISFKKKLVYEYFSL